jgi:hypothetical protein
LRAFIGVNGAFCGSVLCGSVLFGNELDRTLRLDLAGLMRVGTTHGTDTVGSGA